MLKDKKVVIMGLGVTDPKGIFGTTIGLEKIFGQSRVIETPTSENAITGIIIGTSATIFGIILGVTFSMYVENLRQFLIIFVHFWKY